uniref:Uncharacterized protein n=1 Tax=Oryza nivara TaxID=4536 RepID=A0A0E0GRW8_ORYNI
MTLKWIDMMRVTFIGARKTQPETTTQFIRMWIEDNSLNLPEWSERPKCGCRDRYQANPRRYKFTFWINIVNPTYDSGRVTEAETQIEYM